MPLYRRHLLAKKSVELCSSLSGSGYTEVSAERTLSHMRNPAWVAGIPVYHQLCPVRVNHARSYKYTLNMGRLLYLVEKSLV